MMAIVTAVVVIVFGTLTLILHDETFIKMKPTLYYLLVAGLLGFGLWTGRPLLKMVLGSAYPGLDAEGWRKLTRNWTWFFLGMAVVNELVWRNSTTNFWVGFKLWGAIPLTFLFAALNIPMLMKHGLTRDEAEPVEAGPVE
jgi:intracellular septation protein